MSSNPAPTTMVSLLTATDWPRRSSDAPSDAVSLAFWVRVPLQPPTGFTNTCAEPWLPFTPMSSKCAPTTTVSPLTATENPNCSSNPPSPAISLALSVKAPLQPPAGFTNTYVEPWLILAPMSSNPAPTTMVSPLTATE